MDLHIDELKLSYHAKNTLHELGFTMVSDLKGHDYVSLIQKFPLKASTDSPHDALQPDVSEH